MRHAELLNFIARAITDDDSVETGEVRIYPKGLLVEVTPAWHVRTPHEENGALAATYEVFAEAARAEFAKQNPPPALPVVLDVSAAEDDDGVGGELSIFTAQPAADYEAQAAEFIAAEWAKARPHFLAGLPPVRESARVTVRRAIELIVAAINGDEFPETGKAVALGEQRFRLEGFDGSQWIGSVMCFAPHFQNELVHYWPGRPPTAPEVFGLRVVKMRETGGDFIPPTQGSEVG